MSEFHRMITYLYLYEQGQKSRNIGFAKIEQRDRQCLLEIHMKNTGCSLTPVPVYFYVKKETRLAGIPLGNFSLIRGSGDFKIILDAEDIKGSGYSLNKVKGIYIPLTLHMMSVSQWDDDEFRLADFVDITEMQPQNTPEEKPRETASDNSANAGSENALKAAEALPRTAQPASGALPSQKPSVPDQKASSRDQKASSPDQKASTPGRASNHSKGSDSIHPQNNASNHPQDGVPEKWDLRWRFILENYPVMTPFSGDENTICVRMELKDLRQLPRQFWYLGNNSFLLHGFFNYRYYILGMTEEFGVRRWFIGVPGVFQNPERVMAALFGFPEFRSEKPAPIKTGEFGYWYRYLNELSEPADNPETEEELLPHSDNNDT